MAGKCKTKCLLLIHTSEKKSTVSEHLKEFSSEILSPELLGELGAIDFEDFRNSFRNHPNKIQKGEQIVPPPVLLNASPSNNSLPPVTKWINWAHNQSCEARIFYPQNENEIASIVQEAIRLKIQMIRPTGYGHSWSPIVPVSEGSWIIDSRR
jgi:hypothetical protein